MRTRPVSTPIRNRAGPCRPGRTAVPRRPYRPAKSRRTPGTRRGWVLPDAIVGLGLIGATAALLAVTLRAGRLTTDRLADARAASRLAERCLLAARDGRPLPEIPDRGSVAVRPAPGGAAPPGLAWATVDVAFRGRHAALVGLVRPAALPGDRP